MSPTTSTRTSRAHRVTDSQDVAVVGGGMAGMLAALMLARDGHRVTVYERDDTDLPDTADEAFDGWDRRGVPHARQSHALLGRLRKGWYWPDAHNEVVRRILKLAHRGTRVILIAGNHDEMLRPYAGMSFGGVELALETIHETADGRRLLVTHGDGFDGVVLYARWLAFLGDKAYALLLRANVLFNLARRQFKLPYWSLSAYIKKKVKNAVQFVCDFEEAVAHAARDMGVDGVVCGHIHCAEIRQIGDVTYYNDGDWVESCTALVEDASGAMSIVDWAEETRRAAALKAVLKPIPLLEEEPA